MEMEKAMNLEFTWYPLIHTGGFHSAHGNEQAVSMFKEELESRLECRKKLWPQEENKTYEIKDGRNVYCEPTGFYTRLRDWAICALTSGV